MCMAEPMSAGERQVHCPEATTAVCVTASDPRRPFGWDRCNMSSKFAGLKWALGLLVRQLLPGVDQLATQVPPGWYPVRLLGTAASSNTGCKFMASST
jgi:hypothetical protein